MDSFRELGVAAERCFLKVLGVYKMQPPETKDPVLRDLGQRYGLKFVTEDELDCEDLTYGAPVPTQLSAVRDRLVEEISVYPRQAIEKSRIEQIVLCSDLRLGKKRAVGTLKVGLHYVDTLYIDVTDFKFNENHARRTFHHELFHAIDFRDTFHGYLDPEWRQLQGDNYRYQLETAIDLHIVMGNDPQDVHPREFDDPYFRSSAEESDSPGFVSEYAKYSISEDKAELYSFMIVNYKDIMRRAKRDEVLNRKVGRMKELLHDYIPEIDEAFWRDVVAKRKIED